MLKSGLYHEVVGIGPLQYKKVWVMKLKTPHVLRALVAYGRMQVKERYCAIIDPAVEEVWFKVHWVPLQISNASLRRGLQEYGTVKKVSSQMWSKDEAVAKSTTRHVRLCLKEGLEVKDLPHLWLYKDRSLLIDVPGRPPLCQKCSTRGHSTFGTKAAMAADFEVEGEELTAEEMARWRVQHMLYSVPASPPTQSHYHRSRDDLGRWRGPGSH
ncbi:hypothetical protein HPB49_007969 [Dermacentor silvarum]|uniref:Uncharacterized protein n=1 Tax=Dermacentor silvarum TaxID=543639 RepID=A0ACB8DXA9_DERSI|nr:hypothetical protein HPB49_007969 [Dermacentor silvarum]